MTMRAVVRGVGHYLPARVVPNSELETLVDTSDEWIRSRSGIERRHFAAEDETTSILATHAARAALADAGLDGDDLDVLEVLGDCTEHHATDATETVDTDFNCHCVLS